MCRVWEYKYDTMQQNTYEYVYVKGVRIQMWYYAVEYSRRSDSLWMLAAYGACNGAHARRVEYICDTTQQKTYENVYVYGVRIYI